MIMKQLDSVFVFVDFLRISCTYFLEI